MLRNTLLSSAANTQRAETKTLVYGTATVAGALVLAKVAAIALAGAACGPAAPACVLGAAAFVP